MAVSPFMGTGGQSVDSEPVDRGEETVSPGAADAPEAGAVEAVLTDEERGERLSQLTGLIDLMRPAVQADGGDLALLFADVATGVVEVQLQGACSSCAVSASTL